MTDDTVTIQKFASLNFHEIVLPGRLRKHGERHRADSEWTRLTKESRNQRQSADLHHPHSMKHVSHYMACILKRHRSFNRIRNATEKIRRCLTAPILSVEFTSVLDEKCDYILQAE